MNIKPKFIIPFWAYSIIAFITSFASLIIIMIVVFFLLSNAQNKVKINQIIQSCKSQQVKTQTEIQQKLQTLHEDLEILANMIKKSDLLGDSIIRDIFLHISLSRKNYDQIRYIDKEGYEVIRVDNPNKNRPIIIQKDKLQNKKARYYFNKSIILPKNEFYLSALDLNVENGKISNPVKPMLRISTPIYKNNLVEGILIINYRAKALFSSINPKNPSAKEQKFITMIINNEGYWLNNQKNKFEYSFMYPDKKELSFSSQFQKEWKLIKQHPGSPIETKKGIFYCTTVDTKKLINSKTNSIKNDNQWWIVDQITPEIKKAIVQSTLLYYKKVSIYFIIPSLLISLLVAILYGISKQREGRLRIHATYDSLTNCLNLRTGMHLFSEVFSRAKKLKQPLFIGFIDINNLKTINDRWGHVEGDHLIQTIAKIIQNSLRESDFLTRIGGDEFLLVLQNSNKILGNQVIQRIENNLKQYNQLNDHPYELSASIGCIVTKKENETRTIKELIKQADTNMYKEKKKRNSSKADKK